MNRDTNAQEKQLIFEINSGDQTKLTLYSDFLLHLQKL